MDGRPSWTTPRLVAAGVMILAGDGSARLRPIPGDGASPAAPGAEPRPRSTRGWRRSTSSSSSYVWQTLRRLGVRAGRSWKTWPTTCSWWCTGGWPTTIRTGRCGPGCSGSPTGGVRASPPAGDRPRAAPPAWMSPRSPTRRRHPNGWSPARRRAVSVALALEQLPLEQRAVFVLHDIDGVSAPEIARALERAAQHRLLPAAAGAREVPRRRCRRAWPRGDSDEPIRNPADPCRLAIEALLGAEREAPPPPPAMAARVFRPAGQHAGLAGDGAAGSLLASAKVYVIAALLAAGVAAHAGPRPLSLNAHGCADAGGSGARQALTRIRGRNCPRSHCRRFRPRRPPALMPAHGGHPLAWPP